MQTQHLVLFISLLYIHHIKLKFQEYHIVGNFGKVCNLVLTWQIQLQVTKLRLQITNVKVRQYQWRAISPNLMLTKVMRYTVCLESTNEIICVMVHWQHIPDLSRLSNVACNKKGGSDIQDSVLGLEGGGLCQIDNIYIEIFSPGAWHMQNALCNNYTVHCKKHCELVIK